MLKAGTPEKVDQEPIGTGPFQLVNYQKDAVIRYKAFPEYWGGKAKIDDLVFAITKGAARLAKLKANECQVMIAPESGRSHRDQGRPQLNLLEQAGLNVGYLSMNFTKPPFDKKEVRQAVNMAINKADIMKEVYQGAGQPAKNPIPPTIWSYSEATKDYDYNPDGQGDAQGRRRRISRPAVVDAGVAPLQPQCQAHGRDDAVRSRQGRHQRQARFL